jgi:eukaryotic-like serine/threonine-protein kinase
MKCPACAHENFDDASFCGGCGSSLSHNELCPFCGRLGKPGERFCQGCGTSRALGPPDRPSTSAKPDERAGATATLPSSFGAGRYNVRSFLGEGAKKRVFLAHDTKLDRDVAFALIKTDGLDADGLVRVRREAQAMGRLGDHSHIVTVFDAGDEGGAPYIVAQHMAGGSVEDLLATAEQHRLPPEQAMRIAEQVALALAHAHARGIVHRDLKPGNVWLADDGNAALGDFGLAIALDRSRMTMAGMMVGTVAYMAPEQALGRTPDARSDLYALGAMLYEMVCGRPPFLGDDAVGVISQHINTAPIAPAWHNSDIPRSLDALILRLLAKSPDERPASAPEVATELRRIIERAVDEKELPAVPPIPHILEGLPWGAFVGRREEMDQLKEALEGALSGRGSLAMIVGEPGIGKTRLAEEFAVYSGLRGAQVLTGRSYEGEASVPYRPFIEALRQYVRSRPDDELRSQMGPGAPEIATMVSDVRQRFPDIEGAPTLEPEAERLRLFESITQFLRNAAAGSPLVIHLDDLHWADQPSLRLLQHMARSTAADRLLIVGAYRDVELDRTHPLSDALAALRRLPNFHRVLLRGLPLETVSELLGVLEPSEDAAAGRAALATALHRETEGNPFFIREVIAHLIETGKLAHEGGRWVGKVATISDLGIPEGVREVIGRRLSRVSPGCNRMLTAASTMTGGFSWEALRAINPDMQEAELLDVLEEALRAQLVAERKGDATGSYDFTHALIRQTLYDELSTPRRVLMHRQIGEALEALYADDADAHLAELAHHFYQAAPGGDIDKAIDLAMRAGDRAQQVQAHEEACFHFERALQLLDLQREPDERQRCIILLSINEARWRGDLLTADTAQQALAVARAIGDAELFAEAAVRVSRLVNIWSGHDDVTSLLHEALDGLPVEDSRERTVLLLELALREDWIGSAGDRFSRIDEAAAMARRMDDRAMLARVLNIAHGFRVGLPERWAERRALTDELAALSPEEGDPVAAYNALMPRVVDVAEIGDLEGLEAVVRAMYALAERTRQPSFLALATIRQAFRPLAEGRLEVAEPLVLDAIAIAQRTRLWMANMGPSILNLRQLQGRLAEMEPLVKRLVEDGPLLFSYRCSLAWIYGESNRLDDARGEFERLAETDFRSLPRDSTWIISMYLLTEVCAVLEDRPRAEELYDLLLPYAGQNMVVQPALICTGSVSRQLGMMASVAHHWDDAERHFDDALAFDAKMGARPWLAHSQYNYARMLAARKAPGDHRRAMELLREALDTAYELGLKKIIERGLALKLELQGVTGTGIYASIDAVAGALQRERPDISTQAAADGTIAIMFGDIEASTPLNQRMGDDAYAALLREYTSAVRSQVESHRGHLVKHIGDGFMAAFPRPSDALACALAIQEVVGQAALAEPIRVRIGLHAGSPVQEGADFFGVDVTLASRITDLAAGGEILVSAVLRGLVESGGNAAMFGQSRDVELKGLTGVQTVFSVFQP